MSQITSDQEAKWVANNLDTMAPEAKAKALAALRSYDSSTSAAQRPPADAGFAGTIRTDAIPTGNSIIDGVPEENVPAPMNLTHGKPSSQQDQSEVAKLERKLARESWQLGKGRTGAPDSDERLMYEEAQKGVDYRQGTGVGNAFKEVLNLPTPAVQKQVFEEIVDSLAATLPDGSPMIRTNMDTGDVQYLRAITEADIANGYEPEGSVGEFRWTSTNASGMTPESLAKLFDLSEIGSIVGGVYGSVATRNLTFFKAPAASGRLARKGKFGDSEGYGFKSGSRGTATEGAFGLAGREIGNIIRLGVSMGQGREINWMEALDMMGSDIGKEAVAAIGGRSAQKSLEMLKSGVVKTAARLQGLTVVDGTAEGVAARQASMRQASEDNEVLNRQLEDVGHEERITTSLAESETTLNKKGRGKAASGQQSRINEEHSRRVNAGQANRELAIERDADTIVGLRAVADAQTERQAASIEFDATAANRVVKDAESIRISAVEGQPTRGRIHPGGVKSAENGARSGIEFEVRPESLDIVGSGLPKDVQGIGLGEDMYREFLELATREGKSANSGRVLTLDADRMWRKMIEDGYPVVRSSKVMPTHDALGAVDGYIGKEPIYSLKAPKPFVSDAVAMGLAARSPRGSKAARDRANTQFDRLMSGATSKELAAIKNEVGQNYARRIDMLEEVFQHYERNVNAGNKYAGAEAREEWMESSSRMLEAVLTPEEFLRVRGGSPGEFRRVFNSLASSRDDMLTGLGDLLKVGNTDIFRKNKPLLSLLRNAGNKERKRALRLIEHTDPQMYQALQAEVRKEVGERMFTPVSGNTVSRARQKAFGEWLVDNTKMLNDMFPDEAFLAHGGSRGNTEYVNNLFSFNRALARESSRQGAKAPRLVVNTPLLQMSRTVMGVMNKWQRRVTAGRKLQMQKWYGRVVDIVESPDKLAELVAFSELQPRLGDATGATVAAAVRLGLVEDEQEFNEFMSIIGQWQQWDMEEE